MTPYMVRRAAWRLHTVRARRRHRRHDPKPPAPLTVADRAALLRRGCECDNAQHAYLLRLYGQLLAERDSLREELDRVRSA
jgi:hypothetical protein